MTNSRCCCRSVLGGVPVCACCALCVCVCVHCLRLGLTACVNVVRSACALGFSTMPISKNVARIRFVIVSGNKMGSDGRVISSMKNIKPFLCDRLGRPKEVAMHNKSQGRGCRILPPNLVRRVTNTTAEIVRLLFGACTAVKKASRSKLFGEKKAEWDACLRWGYGQTIGTGTQTTVHQGMKKKRRKDREGLRPHRLWS